MLNAPVRDFESIGLVKKSMKLAQKGVNFLMRKESLHIDIDNINDIVNDRVIRNKKEEEDKERVQSLLKFNYLNSRA